VAAKTILCTLLFSASVFAAEPAEISPVAKVFDSQLNSLEREVVSLAEAMPAEKYSFAPKDGDFKGVRTFAQQVTHIATVNYEVASVILGEINPVEMGSDENGAAGLKSKEQIVEYLKKSFAYTHRAMRMLTHENLMEPVQNAFSPKTKAPRLSMATIPQWHSFDHYGQMAVYARMCGVVPPASRPRN
jgi:uncharacterized damage-inducible protein DinB